jgi:hypothetical protein
MPDACHIGRAHDLCAASRAKSRARVAPRQLEIVPDRRLVTGGDGTGATSDLATLSRGHGVQHRSSHADNRSFLVVQPLSCQPPPAIDVDQQGIAARSAPSRLKIVSGIGAGRQMPDTDR